MKVVLFFSDCEAAVELGINISYFDSLEYLQTVVFTIGYGHIIPNCHTGKVSQNLKRSVKTANSIMEITIIFRCTLSYLLMWRFPCYPTSYSCWQKRLLK